MGERVRFLVLVLVLVVCSVSGVASAQNKEIKKGLTEEDWAYAMPEGVTSKVVTFYSDGVACFGEIFYPKDFDEGGKTPAVILGQGWTGTARTIAKYAARFAERGLVAMVIDYRGWGKSDGYVSLVGHIQTEDATRFTETEAAVMIKRTRLLPLKQVEDFRNAISYIQGEPGVNPERIGTWGSSYAGGHQITLAAIDARVKAAVAQVPAIGGKGSPEGPVKMNSMAVEDAIKRAREGQGNEFPTGFSLRRNVDVETLQMNAEYRPYHSAKFVVAPILFIVAENEELINNQDGAYAASKVVQGPAEVLEIAGITHFEMYVGEAFEQGSNAAADWFRKHLGMD